MQDKRAIGKQEELDSYETMNDVLVVCLMIFGKLKSEPLSPKEFKDITANDMHIIEAVGIGQREQYVIHCQSGFRLLWGR